MILLEQVKQMALLLCILHWLIVSPKQQDLAVAHLFRRHKHSAVPMSATELAALSLHVSLKYIKTLGNQVLAAFISCPCELTILPE